MCVVSLIPFWEQSPGFSVFITSVTTLSLSGKESGHKTIYYVLTYVAGLWIGTQIDNFLMRYSILNFWSICSDWIIVLRRKLYVCVDPIILL